jgi:hypothetical protein
MQEARVQGTCDLTLSTSQGTLSSFSQVQFFNSFGIAAAAEMQGTHSIGSLAQLAWGVSHGYYSGTRTATWSSHQCYVASNYAQAYPAGIDNPPVSGGPWNSNEQCAPNPDPPPEPPSQCGGNTDFTSGCSPIVFNFERGAYRLTGLENPVLFDIAASGNPVHIGWTAAGADEAFLAVDRDHSGAIETGAELFGTATPLQSGAPAGNGFVALLELDDDANGLIDERDSIWTSLLLWRDWNHDGHSQPAELSPMATSDMTAISLSYHWTGRRDRSGNFFRYTSTVFLTQRSVGGSTPRPVYDIFFVSRP